MKLWINRIRGLPVQAKATIVFFASNVVSTGIAYICTPIFTRLLTSEEYGRVVDYQTWKQIFGIFAMFCLSYGVFNNGMSDYPKKRNEYSFSMLILSNLITLFFSVIAFSLYPIATNKTHLDISILVIMFTLFLFQPAYSFWTVRERFEYKYKKIAIWAVLSAIISPTFAIVAMLYSRNNRFFSRVAGAEIPLIVIYVGFYIYVASKSNWKVDTSFWKKAILFNLPLIPHYLSTYLLSSSDKIMITELVGESATAYYGVAYTVASVALILWSAVNASLLPFTYEKCAQKDYKAVSDATLPVLYMFAGVCVVVTLLAPEIVFIMAPSDYTQAVIVIPPVVGGVFFQVHYYVYANVIYYYKKPRYVMFASVSAVTINIVLNYLFIPRYGFIAAGYTTLICYLLQAILDFLAMRNVVKDRVYDMKKLVPLSIAVLVFAGFGNLLYINSIVRIALLIVVVLVGVINRKSIYQTIFCRLINALK